MLSSAIAHRARCSCDLCSRLLLVLRSPCCSWPKVIDWAKHLVIFMWTRSSMRGLSVGLAWLDLLELLESLIELLSGVTGGSGGIDDNSPALPALF